MNDRTKHALPPRPSGVSFGLWVAVFSGVIMLMLAVATPLTTTIKTIPVPKKPVPSVSPTPSAMPRFQWLQPPQRKMTVWEFRKRDVGQTFGIKKPQGRTCVYAKGKSGQWLDVPQLAHEIVLIDRYGREVPPEASTSPAVLFRVQEPVVIKYFIVPENEWCNP